MQLDPVLPPHISAAHGQMKLRDVIGQDNMQDYKTWFSGCVRILVFHSLQSTENAGSECGDDDTGGVMK